MTGSTEQLQHGSQAWTQAARLARRLSWFSLVWMSAEGVLGLIAGIQAGSIALIGWALSSVIEGLASIIVIWRFSGARTLSESSERTAHKAVAISFFLLAPYIAVEAVHKLIVGSSVETSLLGVVATSLSLLIMPALGLYKRGLGRRLGSGATSGEGTQNLLCAYLAGAVLLGLATNALLGWWWADPVIALVIAADALREGREAWEGEDCC